MEQQINVAEEVDRIANQMGIDIENITQNETEQLERVIMQLKLNVTNSIISGTGLPRGRAADVAESLCGNLAYRLRNQLRTNRQSEYNETKSNLSATINPELQAISDGLSRFQNNGIASKDAQYNNAIEEICEESIRSLEHQLDRAGASRSRLEVIRYIRGSAINIQDIHKDYTRRIKQDISNKLGELGLRVTDALNRQIGQTVAEKSQDGFSDFAKAMQSQTKSTDEVTREDAKELSENEAAFRGSVEPRTTTKKDLEAMFK